jgi:DNA-directed RNA polymerase subunit H (RpoH/RPB5)
MEHVVFHPGTDGSPAFRRFGSLEDAVRFVEHLRNVEGVSEVSVHSLAPVQLSFRAYYKVEVPADRPVVDVPAPSEPVLESVPVAQDTVTQHAVVEHAVVEHAAVESVMAEPVMAEAQLAEGQYADAVAAAEQPSNGKRSLGFFAH